MSVIDHLSGPELEAGLDDIRRSPTDDGVLTMIVRRPAVGEREILEEGRLSPTEGLEGDSWAQRPSRSSPDGKANPGKQITLINSRVALLVSGAEERAALTGDQLHVDLDLSTANLPTGTRLHVGDAVIEISEHPHTGCSKFTQRFGLDAMRFVTSPAAAELRLRGANARVVTSGTVRRGDRVRVERPPVTP